MQFVDECSALSPESAGVRYSHSEVRALLDLCAQWLEERPEEREVVILTGTACCLCAGASDPHPVPPEPYPCLSSASDASQAAHAAAS